MYRGNQYLDWYCLCQSKTRYGGSCRKIKISCVVCRAAPPSKIMSPRLQPVDSRQKGSMPQIWPDSCVKGIVAHLTRVLHVLRARGGARSSEQDWKELGHRIVQINLDQSTHELLAKFASEIEAEPAFGITETAGERVASSGRLRGK